MMQMVGPVIKIWVTIERIVFNEIALFNINYFSDDESYTVGGENNESRLTIKSSEANLLIRQSISKMFMVCRIIASAALFLVLIYIGIRMALSTVTADKAKYKKMLISWVESVVILFLLHYIMIMIVYFGESLTNIFYDWKSVLVENGGRSFEDTISNGIFDMITGTSGLTLAQHSIMYWILVFSQFKFLYLYMKRTLMTGFLIAIAPLITITYSIDKAGDGRAQAFGTWLKEFLFTVLIQPLHALIYLIFMFSAGAIAEYAPWVALLFMMSLGSAEKIVRTIFNVADMSTMGQISEFLKKKK